MEVHGNVAEITFRRHSCLLRKPPPERSGGGLLFLVKMNRQSTFHSFALEADGPRWGVPSIADPSIVTRFPSLVLAYVTSAYLTPISFRVMNFYPFVAHSLSLGS